MSEKWWLYMVECKGGKIYTGIALDVDARFLKHLHGKGAAFTKLNPPLRILARKEFPSRRQAAQAEYAMKKLPAVEKWRWAFALGGLAGGDNRADGVGGM